MKHFIVTLLVGFWLLGPHAFADVNAKNGISITTASTINGKTPNSAFNGLAIASGGAPTPDVLWWRLNDASGTAIVADVGPDGTTNATLNSDYIALNGTSQYAQSNSAPTYGSRAITISYWVYATDWAAGAENVHFESGANYGSGPLRFSIGHSGSTVTPIVYQSGGGLIETFGTIVNSMSNATWYNLTFVIDTAANSNAGSITCYLDGNSVSTTNALNTLSSSGNFEAATLNLGSRNAASSWFGGRLDNLRIYGRALSGSEVTSIFTAGR